MTRRSRTRSAIFCFSATAECREYHFGHFGSICTHINLSMLLSFLGISCDLFFLG